jgi:choline dehydrogenase-like flavoprotein
MEYDYVVIGGGSAGCLTAGRLVRDHGARVLLLEQGGRDNNPLIHMPAGYVKLLSSNAYMTFHKASPDSYLGGRTPVLPQGKVLGGGSSVNAMVYIRGQRKDYEAWQQLTGDAGWSFEQLLPYFIRMEGNGTFGGPMHGTDGPLKVSDADHVCDLSRRFVLSAQEAGIPFTVDFNRGNQNGVGFFQLTTRDGRRCSAVDAFLKPVFNHPGLKLATHARVNRIEIERERATGVHYTRYGRQLFARARQEVIVAAGALSTPKLLMLSGIGPAQHLRHYGIDVVVDLPGIGENLQDHHEVPVMAFCRGRHGYYGQDVGLNRLANGAQYMLFRSGPVTSNGVEAGAFVNPDKTDDDPSLQLFCVPTVYLDKDISDVQPTHGFTLNSCLLQPKSRGAVMLRSADPAARASVTLNYLRDPEDMRLSIAGLRLAREIASCGPLSRIVDREILPGPDAKTDEDLAAHCRRTVKTVYHPVGTCRMGHDADPMAVLTPDMRVRGVQGLRVFDASAMPSIISGNTNAAVLAMADKGTAMMMGEDYPAVNPAPRIASVA